jgi:hypothetical protein
LCQNKKYKWGLPNLPHEICIIISLGWNKIVDFKAEPYSIPEGWVYPTWPKKLALSFQCIGVKSQIVRRRHIPYPRRMGLPHGLIHYGFKIHKLNYEWNSFEIRLKSIENCKLKFIEILF